MRSSRTPQVRQGGYGRKKPASETDKSRDMLVRLKNAMDAYQNAPVERTISAMDVIVSYTAIMGRVQHRNRGEEHLFKISVEKMVEKPLNVYAVRDEFFRVKEWSEALVFLETTGLFSSGSSITWSEFKKWQRFAYLVQEHDALTVALRDHNRGVFPKFSDSEVGKVVITLIGKSASSFFEIPPSARQEQRLLDFCTWFREPPEWASSIEWVPIIRRDRQAVWRELRQLDLSSAILQFFLPKSALRPYLLIRPTYTLQAIAAAIYADRIHGVEYRACEMCKALFKVGAHKEKKYCDRERCKNNAHQRNRRANTKKNRLSGEAKKGRQR